MDYVGAEAPIRFEYVDVESADRGNVFTAVSYHGQRMQLDLLLHGKATLAGHVYAADGVTPLPEPSCEP